MTAKKADVLAAAVEDLVAAIEKRIVVGEQLHGTVLDAYGAVKAALGK